MEEELDKELFNAIHENNLERVRELISAGSNIEAKFGIHEHTPLIIAILNNNLEMITLLIELGANIEETGRKDFSYKGNTPLMVAINRNKSPEMVKLLIDLGADIEAQNTSYQTPLMIAISKRNLKLVKLLVELGADINAKSRDFINERSIEIKGKTIMNFLQEIGDQQMIDVIIEGLRIREIREKNEKIRAQKKAFYNSMILSERVPSVPLTGLYSGINFDRYIAEHIADYAFGEEENEGSEETKRSDRGDAGVRSRKKKSRSRKRKSSTKKRKSKTKRRSKRKSKVKSRRRKSKSRK